MAAMFFYGSKFREQFLKRVTQRTFLGNNSQISPRVSEKKTFLRICLCRYSVKSLPHPWRPCFLTDHNFTYNFKKKSPKEQSCEILSKSDKPSQKRRILKNFSEVHTMKKAPLPAPSQRPCF